jgi:hypothetical protein
MHHIRLGGCGKQITKLSAIAKKMRGNSVRQLIRRQRGMSSMFSEIFGKIVDIRPPASYKEKTLLICFPPLRLFSLGAGDQAEEIRQGGTLATLFNELSVRRDGSRFWAALRIDRSSNDRRRP